MERDDEPALAPLDLRRVLGMLRHRIWLIVAVTALCGGLAAWVALNTLPIYEATGTVRLSDSRRQLTGGLVDPTENVGGIRGTTDPVLSEIAVLTSRAVIGKVIDSLPALRVRAVGFPRLLVSDFDLDTAMADSVHGSSVALDFGSKGVVATGAGHSVARAAYGSPVSVAGMHFTITAKPRQTSGKVVVMPIDNSTELLARAIKAKARENTNIIDVSYQSTDPGLAQRAVNALIEAFQQNSVDIAAQEARLRRQFVESQLRQNDSLLADARFSLSEFRSREKAYSARDKFAAQATDLNQVRQQIQEIDAQQAMYSSVLDAMDAGRGKESLQQLGALLSSQGAAASAVVTDAYMQMVHLQSARDSLLTAGMAGTNPDVQRIDTLTAKASVRLKTTLKGITATLATRLSALQRVRDQSSAQLSAIPASDADEARLTEREAAYEKVGDQLRDELQKARLSEAAEVGSVDIVDRAMRPQVPIGTKANRKIMFGVILGLFLGAGLGLVLEQLDQSIRGRDEIETSLQLPGLAVIPRTDPVLLTKRVRKALTARKDDQPGGAKKPVSASLVTLNDSRSVSAEAYRTLRTKLLFSRALSTLKTIVVTSPFAQDGKSTVAANLATTFAQHGMKTLLIDCDLRRPTQHEVFGVSSRPGLTELLTSEELIPGAGRRTSVENLSLITAGALPPDPPELVGSARMRALLEKLGETFDVIVLDTPPVLPVADSAILASLADGVLLVVRAGKTDRRAAQLAVQQLQDVDARILGAVLNDPNEQVPLYDQYGYASYYGYAARE